MIHMRASGQISRGFRGRGGGRRKEEVRGRRRLNNVASRLWHGDAALLAGWALSAARPPSATLM